MTKDLKEQLQFNIEESIKETEQKLDTIPKTKQIHKKILFYIYKLEKLKSYLPGSEKL